MRKLLFAAALGSTLLAAGAASAQDGITSSFRGFRLEAQGGGDRFQSQGVHDDKFGFGAAAGFDGVINDRIVVGPEVGYWRARGENVTSGVTGGTIAHKSFQEYTASVRVGYLFTPKLLGYAVGGYANSEQRKYFSGINGQGGFYDHFSTDGYQVGGGAEYSLTDMFYVGAGYRYSNYDDHTARQRVYGSVGVRFK